MKQTQLLKNLLSLSGKTNKWITRRFEEYLFPALCLICDSGRETGSSWFCPECNKSLTSNSSLRLSCNRCGQNLSIRKCTCEISWDYPFDRIYSIFDYDENLQELVRHIKYRGKKSLACSLASFSPFSTDLKNSYDAVIAVPLHWTRYRKRGYNQAEWFAKGIAVQSGLPLITKILQRSRGTGTQTKLDRSDRQNNMKKAFRVDERYRGAILGKRVLLADDVVTTGATTASCAEVLLEAGCVSVGIVSIARD
jgi:ComF family protein